MVQSSETLSLSWIRVVFSPIFRTIYSQFDASSLAAYYVSPTGDDANSGTTSSAPFRTISKVCSLNAAYSAGPLYLMPGVHDFSIACDMNMDVIGDSHLTTTLNISGEAQMTFFTFYYQKVQNLNVIGEATGPSFPWGIFFVWGGRVAFERITADIRQSSVIYIQGESTINNCTFRSNTRAAVSNRSPSVIRMTDESSLLVNNTIIYGSKSLLVAPLQCTESTLTVENSHFYDNVGYVGGAILGLNSCDMTITNSTFIGNEAILDIYGGAGGAIGAQNSPNVRISGCTFKKNRALSGSAIATLATIPSLPSGSNEISDNFFEEGTSGVLGGVILAQSMPNSVPVYIKNNIFFNNSADNCTSLQIIESKTYIEGNLFDANFAEHGPCTICVRGLSYTTGVRRTTHIKNNIFRNNTFGSLPPTEMTDPLIRGDGVTDVVIYENEFIFPDGLNPDRTVAFGLYGNISVSFMPNSSNPLAPLKIPGMTIGMTTIKLHTHLLFTLTFNSISIPSLQLLPRINQLDLNGYNLTVRVENDYFGKRPSWIQNMHVYHGNLIHESQSVYCCNFDPGNIRFIHPMGIFVTNTSVYFRANALLVSAFEPIVMDSASKMVVQYGAVANAIYPFSPFASEFGFSNKSLVMYGDVIVENGHWAVSDFVHFGNFHVKEDGLLQVYPSRWRNSEHLLNVTGTLQIEGKIATSPRYELTIFQPNVELDEQPRTVAVAGSLTWSGATETFGAVKYQVQKSGNLLGAIPKALIASPEIDNTGGSILFSFPIPVTSHQNSSCADILPANTTQFDLSRISCVWESLKSLRISSPALPPFGDLVLFDDPTGVIAGVSLMVGAAKSPITPTAIIKTIPTVVSCGSVVLDASPSYGIGSYQPIFEWSLIYTNDTASSSDIQTFLSSHNSTIVSVPTSYLTPGYMYSFGVRVTNWAFITSPMSQPVNVTYVASSRPALVVEGSSNRLHYTGNPLTIQGKLEDPGCQSTTSTQIQFEWFFIGNGSSTPTKLSQETISSSGSTPALFVPSSSFKVEQDLVFRLVAKNGNSVLASMDVKVQVIQSPFTIASVGRTHFYAEDVVLKTVVKTTTGASVDLDYSWSLIDCPFLNGEKDLPKARPLSATESLFSLSDTNCLFANGSVMSIPLGVEAELTISQQFLEPGTYQALVTGVSTTNSDLFSSTVIQFTYEQQPSVLSVEIVAPQQYQIRANEKFVLKMRVDGKQGLDIDPSLLLEWKVMSGSYEIPPEHVNLPTLIIPYSVLESGQEITIRAQASFGPEIVPARDGKSFTASAVFNLTSAVAPFGGYVKIEPETGRSYDDQFVITAPSWSSRFAPLKYQFSIEGDQALGIPEQVLSEVIDIPSISGVKILRLNNQPQGNMTVKVRVFDSFGTMTIATTTVNVLPSTSPINSSFLNDLNVELEQALISSNWRKGNQIVGFILNGINQMLNLGQTLNTAFVNSVVSNIVQLASKIPPTETSTFFILNQLDELSNRELGPAQKQQILNLLSRLLKLSESRFGRTSEFAESSMNQFTKTISHILANYSEPSSGNTVDPQLLVFNHGQQILQSMDGSEEPVELISDQVMIRVEKIESRSGTRRLPTAAEIELDTNGFSSLVKDGYLGYHHELYNDTFPYLPSDTPFRLVSTLSVGETTSQGSTLPGRYKTMFDVGKSTISVSETPQCSLYDSSTKSWTNNGCTTSTNGGQVTCDCNKVAPLTVLFGQVGGKSGMSGAAIAGIVVSVLVIAVICVLILIFVFHPKYQLMAFKKLKQPTNDVDSSPSPPVVHTPQEPVQPKWAAAVKPKP